MNTNKIKLPKAGGVKRVVEAIKKFRNQQPSERLINIIAEYGQEIPDSKQKTN